MGWCTSSSIVLLACMTALPALAQGRWWPPGLAPTSPVAAPPARPAPAATPASTTTAIAAFPDVVPERPKPPADPAAELLAGNPYEAQLTARKIAENLYGDDPGLANPYEEELRLVNPYATDRRVASPTANAMPFENPYSTTLLLEEDPYRRR